MTLRIKLSTGKEIELTQEEYVELTGQKPVQYYHVRLVPYAPEEPFIPYFTKPWVKPIEITCKEEL